MGGGKERGEEKGKSESFFSLSQLMSGGGGNALFARSKVVLGREVGGGSAIIKGRLFYFQAQSDLRTLHSSFCYTGSIPTNIASEHLVMGCPITPEQVLK